MSDRLPGFLNENIYEIQSSNKHPVARVTVKHKHLTAAIWFAKRIASRPQLHNVIFYGYSVQVFANRIRVSYAYSIVEEYLHNLTYSIIAYAYAGALVGGEYSRCWNEFRFIGVTAALIYCMNGTGQCIRHVH